MVRWKLNLNYAEKLKYAACEIAKCSSKSDSSISYSGPMHIVIRSGKHDSSTAYTHSRDFDKLLTLEGFWNCC